MLDRDKQELQVGDRVLAAYNSNGFTYLDRGIIIEMNVLPNAHTATKIRFEDSPRFKTKTFKNYHAYYGMLKIGDKE